jgi:hypothetical protein
MPLREAGDGWSMFADACVEREEDSPFVAKSIQTLVTATRTQQLQQQCKNECCVAPCVQINAAATRDFDRGDPPPLPSCLRKQLGPLDGMTCIPRYGFSAVIRLFDDDDDLLQESSKENIQYKKDEAPLRIHSINLILQGFSSLQEKGSKSHSKDSKTTSNSQNTLMKYKLRKSL